MPELPEVESIRRYLVSKRLEGTKIQRVEVGWADSVATPRHDIEGFANAVSGKHIGRINRRGKYVIAPLRNVNDTSSHLILHMGMTGSVHIREPGEIPVKFRRAVLYLDDGRRIELNDSRRWARLWCVEKPEHAFPNLGPEPWNLTPSEFAQRVKSKRSRIKPALLDQNLVAGVGNIYADESLHRTGISPLRRCNRISITRLETLHSAIIAVLEHAIEFISTHPSADGSPYVVDAYDERMRVTRGSKSNCPDCGQAIVSRSIGGRTAYYCPRCQH